MALPVNLQRHISKADRIREHELLRYYRPQNGRTESSSSIKEGSSTTDTKPALSPDTTLTALAQLVAIRLDVRSVLINVITRDTQYTLSEGTRTLNLGNTLRSDDPDDGLWIGCGTITKSEALCENTVRLPGRPDGPNEFFIVPDLRKDERFTHLPYVKGPPYWRSYIGTPLTTKRGVNIGALCILDDKLHEGFTDAQRAFCETIARTIMGHLEMNREAEERKKGTRMSRGLNAFVEGKTWLGPESNYHGPQHKSRKPQHLDDSPPAAGEIGVPNIDKKQKTAPQGNVLRSVAGVQVEASRCGSGLSEAHSKLSEQMQDASLEHSSSTTPSDTRDSSNGEPDNGQPQQDIPIGHRWTFARAANLLRQSLALQDTGGVVFLETSVGFTLDEDTMSSTRSIGKNSESESDVIPESPVTERAHETHGSASVHTSSPVSFQNTMHRMKKAELLGLSTPDNPLNLDTSKSASSGFTGVPERLLQKLLKHYPRGCLWSFDEDGILSSSEEDIPVVLDDREPSMNSQNKARRRGTEAKLLQSCFPGVRQLLFAPLWDASFARWFSGCFSWTAAGNHIFSRETELNFLVAFGNSVMAEVSRLATIAADQQKGDFIGSISHELRSPLHGILASAEFLAETECDPFQNSLVDTIDSCGRTLLDTINHVLDFSKINSFERNWQKTARKPKNLNDGSSLNALTQAAPVRVMSENAPPLLNIYAVTNVAAICEEVVEGVYAGQVYQDIASADISDITTGLLGSTLERGPLATNRAVLGGSGAQLTGKPISIVLDIDEGDFTFTTQPGALRRVIMNVFGNALKYTDKGLITVKLELHELEGSNITQEDRDAGKLLVVKVTDTGKGISNHYLKTRLFTPFAQENTLAPGTGLGLSIVRSITNMLGGSIDIRSQLGKGTEVKLSIPLMRMPGVGTPVSTPSTTTSLERQQDDSLNTLRAEYRDKFVALYGFEWDIHSFETRRVLRHYITSWYGLSVAVEWPLARIPDIVIVDEEELPDLLRIGLQGPVIMALCSSGSRNSQTTTYRDTSAVVEFVSKPFGPYKLAKALRLCFEKINAARSGLVPPGEPSRGVSFNHDSGSPSLEFDMVPLEGKKAGMPMLVQTTGTITAGETENAQMAVESTSYGSGSNSTIQNNGSDFPFPHVERSSSKPKHKPSDQYKTQGGKRPELKERKTAPTILHRTRHSKDVSKPVSKHGERAVTPQERPKTPKTPKTPARTETSRQEKRSPKILLVDDNKINLRLLQTFMAKRNYRLVDSAENGQLAVQAAKMQEDGYDIIFMDISMPVMNGFEATREIRGIEELRQAEAAVEEPNSGIGKLKSTSPALIIALTGLASSRDQSEAFTSGVDLFLTKPVSFKEVARLLDNWEANSGTSG